MATSRQAEATSTFSEDQRSELAQMIAEAVGSAQAPAAEEQKAAKPSAPAVTDDEWSRMTDRQRQSLVSSMVDFHLDRLAKEDADYERDRKIAELETRKAPEPERPPGIVSKLQKFFWGEPDQK